MIRTIMAKQRTTVIQQFANLSIRPSSAPTPPQLVYFDLETTGLNNPDILQLSAVSADASDVFDDFALPTKAIEPRASEVNGLTYSPDQKALMRKLVMDDGSVTQQRVYAKPLKQVLESFLSWLRASGRPTVLVAYNGLGFDAPVLVKQLKQVGIACDQQVIAGFSDPLRMYKSDPNAFSVPTDGNGNKMDQMLRRFGLIFEGESHNAVHDATNLRRLTLRMVAARKAGPGGDAHNDCVGTLVADKKWFSSLNDMKAKCGAV